MFTPAHFIWIGFCLVFVAGMTAVSRKKRFSLRTAARIMALICAFSEISKILSNMIASPAGGQVLDPHALPFHLCSLMLFGVLFLAFGPSGAAQQAVTDFLAILGLLGSICAILIPTIGTDFRTIDAYQCFVYHAELLWFSIYLLCSGHAKPGLRALRRNLCILLSLTLLMLYMNSILSVYETNFMFLVHPPVEGLPLLNLNHGWYAYFFTLLALVALAHLPFILRERRRSK